MGNIQQVNIKNRTYYLFNDLINIKNFDSNLPERDKKNHTKTLVFIISDTSQWKVLVIILYLLSDLLNTVNPLYW